MADYSNCDWCGEKDSILVSRGKQMLCRDCAERAERELSPAESVTAVSDAFQRVQREMKR